ncbi:unnamed protein product [Parajaminaea phylloscopi]
MRSLSLGFVATATLAATSALGAPMMDDLWARASSSVTSDVNAALAKKYSHVVVGCGLGGLVTAVRLSENSANQVLCIEAGGDSRTDGRVVSFSNYGAAFGTELDWAFQTSSQASAGGNSKVIRGGKTLGGSTAINNGAWGRGDKAQYDAIGGLGAQGISWNTLQPFMKKSEKWVAPQSFQTAAGAQGDAGAHGTNGPVSVAYTPKMYTDKHQKAFVSALQNSIGIRQVSDLASGDIAGVVAYSQNSIQPTGDRIRVSSATAYLSPVENSRPNLVVLTGYRGIKINWAQGNNGGNKAASVVVAASKNGPQKVFPASKAVIVSAGTLRTPQFLEASGVGDSQILNKIGVSQKINLPGVGRGLIEQTMNSIGSQQGNYGVSGQGPSNVIAFPNIYQILSNATDVRSWIESNMDKWAQAAVDSGSAASKDGLVQQYKNTVKLMFDNKVGVVEFFGDHGYPQSGLGIDIWQMMPFSRGYVHSTDATGFGRPDLSPNYFSNPVDMLITVNSLRTGRKVLQDSAIKNGLGETESLPGFGLIPDGPNKGRYDRWENWVLHGNGGNGFASVHHPISTAAMMPRNLGGVVDSNFKVYDTSNVYVVDASVLNQQLSAHLSASLYGLAEKAASVIASA